MGKRAACLDMDRFAVLFFAIMRESEGRRHALDDAGLLRIAMHAFDHQKEQAEAFRLRFLALIEMLNTEEAGAYVDSTEGRMVIHPAMLEAASVVRTRHNGTFPKRPFFEAVGRIAREHYGDFTPRPAGGEGGEEE